MFLLGARYEMGGSLGASRLEMSQGRQPQQCRRVDEFLQDFRNFGATSRAQTLGSGSTQCSSELK